MTQFVTEFSDADIISAMERLRRVKEERRFAVSNYSMDNPITIDEFNYDIPGVGREQKEESNDDYLF